MAMSGSPEELHRKLQDAFNRHDVDAIVELYEPGAVLASRAGTVAGVDAIRDAYREFLALRPRIELETVAVNRAGNIAMLHGKWMVKETGASGVRVRRHGRSAETARLQADGRWLYVIDCPSVPERG